MSAAPVHFVGHSFPPLLDQGPSGASQQTGLRRTTPEDPLGIAARGYRAVAELLRSAPDADVLAEVAAILGSGAASDPRLAPLLAAVRGADEAHLLDASRDLIQGGAIACADPNAPSRIWACVAAELEPDPTWATELRALATLAERAAWAERVGSAGLATAIRDRRAAFLREHAGVCLLTCARRLSAAPAGVLAYAGSALSALLRSESV